MTRDELEHAIRAACTVAGDTEVYVFGSQAISGSIPDAPLALRQSAEADVAPKNFPERSEDIDGALGELSKFHSTHGFYVHGISVETVQLPEGWRERCVPVQNENTNGHTGLCLEGHDLALAKLAAFRDKDRNFVGVLLRERLAELVDTCGLIDSLHVRRLQCSARVRVDALRVTRSPSKECRTTSGSTSASIVAVNTRSEPSCDSRTTGGPAAARDGSRALVHPKR